MVWPVQGIYRVHTARLSVPGRCCRSSCASRGANDEAFDRADKMHLATGYKGRDYDLVGTSYDRSDRTGNVRAKINRSSEVGFPEELDSTIAVGHGVLPETTTRLDPANNESLFA